MKYLAFLISLISIGAAGAIRVDCRGPGASEDRFVYDSFFNVLILDDDAGNFKLNADGKGPGGSYDIENRFRDVPYVSKLERDAKGRPTKLTFDGKLLDKARELHVVLDLRRAQTHAEMEFEKTNGLGVLSQLSCTTSLPQVCTTQKKCWKHCHPMVGCDYICRDETVCKAGKFSSDPT